MNGIATFPEFNNAYREMMEAEGLVISGQSPDGRLVEIGLWKWPIIRLWWAVSYPPELKSRSNRPHPLFLAFVQAPLCSTAGRMRQGTNGVASQQRAPEMQM
ncbi:MAG: hypothetical protein R2856_36390 [Caldilineaceae bacterium]